MQARLCTNLIAACVTPTVGRLGGWWVLEGEEKWQ